MGYTYGYKPAASSGTSAPRTQPLRPGNFYTPPYQQSAKWTDRGPPERVQIPFIENLPQAMQIPGGALEAPIKWGWEAIKAMSGGDINPLLRNSAEGKDPLNQLATWIGDVTPIGAVSRAVSTGLEALSKGQNAVGNAADARLAPHLLHLPDSTVITNALILQAGGDVQHHRWQGKTVREYKQELADRGFNVAYEGDTARAMSWDEVSSIVSKDAMGAYQFGNSPVSTSVPTQMLYQIASDPLNLLFGAGAAMKVVRGARVIAAVGEADRALAAFRAAEAAGVGVKDARVALELADANRARVIERATAPRAPWSESPAFSLAQQANKGLRSRVWGVGMIEDMATAGWRVAKAPSATQSAEALSQGTSQAGTAAGLAQVLAEPQRFLFAEKATSPFMQYYRTGLALQVGGVLVEGASGSLADITKTGDGPDNNIVSGFFSGMHDAFYEINNKHYLSEDPLFTLASVWLLPTWEAAKLDLKTLRGGGLEVNTPRLSEWVRPWEPTFAESSTGIKSAKKAEQELLGRFDDGAAGFATMRHFAIARMAFKEYIQQNPKLKLRLESFEHNIRVKFLAEKLQPMIDDIIAEGKVTEKQLRLEMEEWANTRSRTIFDEETGGFKTDVPREVIADLRGPEIISQWNTYVRAMRRLNEIIDPRLEATIVRADRMDRGSIEDVMAAIEQMAAKHDGMIDSRTLQAWLHRTQAMFEDPGMNPAFWERYMNPGVAIGKKYDFMVEAKPILEEFAKVRDNAPTLDELLHEAVTDEANAAASPIKITDFGDNSPLTPEGVRLVRSQEDVDVVSVEQNVPFAATKRVHLRMKGAYAASWTSKGLPKVPAQWAMNRTIRRHSAQIYDRLVRGTRPAKSGLSEEALRVSGIGEALAGPSETRMRFINPDSGATVSHGNKGYTVDLHKGDFVVLMPGDTEGLVSALTMVRRYYPGADVSVVADGAGRLILMPTKHVKTIDEAMAAARESHSDSIYDHATKKRVEVDYPDEFVRTEPATGPIWEHPGQMPHDAPEGARVGNPWWDEVLRGVALGHLRVPDLMDMGVGQMYAEHITEFIGATDMVAPVEALPAVLYHTTTARSAVLREGLASSEILRAEGKDPAGLAGSPAAVSFTDARLNAELIERDYHTLVDLLQGRRTPMELHDELLEVAKKSTIYTGDIMPAFLHEVNHSIAVVAHGFHEAGQGVRTAEAELADLFKEYLHVREAVGGPFNPIFVDVGQRLADKFIKVDPKDIGVLEVRARPGAQGYHRMDGSISEWRTWHGDAVEVQGGARTRYGFADAEAVARKPWDELRESQKAAIEARGAVLKQLKAQWKALKKEADELRIIRINKRFFDKFKEGRAEFALDDLRNLRDAQDKMRREFPGQYDVGPGPKLMTPWQAHDGPMQALFVERSLLKNMLFDYGPLGRLTNMVNLLTEPVSAAKMVVDARRMYMNYLMPLDATPREIRRYFSLLMEKTKEHRIGPSDAPLFRGSTSLPESVLRDTAHLVFKAKTIAAVEAKYGGRWAAPMNEAYNSLIRRIDTKVFAGGKVGRLERAVRWGYHSIHTTRGFGAAAEGTRMISRVVYPLVRFTIDVRWQAMNYLEADILALGLDGIRSTRMAHTADIIVRHGRKDINVSQQAENLHGSRNQLSRVPGKGGAMPMDMAEAAGVFQTHKRMWPVFNRQFNLRREQNIIEMLDALPRTGAEYANLVKRFGEDPRTWSHQIEDMLYAYDQKGVAFSIRHEAERIRRGDGWTDDEWIAMQPFISRAIERNQKSFDDLVQLHVGNINRSRLERLLNSYWLYWPIGYQLKAGRWLMKTLGEGAFGAKSNMLGAYQINQWAQTFQQQLVTSPALRKEFDDNEALWFAAAMFLPITPFDLGVSLNRGVRYVGGNVLKIWPEYDGIDTPFDAIQRMLSLGPIYTAQLLDSLLRSGYIQELMPDEQSSGPPTYR